MGHTRAWTVDPLINLDSAGPAPTDHGETSLAPRQPAPNWFDGCPDEFVLFVFFIWAIKLGCPGEKLEQVVAQCEEILTRLEDREAGRGLIIKGWAPQAILGTKEFVDEEYNGMNVEIPNICHRFHDIWHPDVIQTVERDNQENEFFISFMINIKGFHMHMEAATLEVANMMPTPNKFRSGMVLNSNPNIRLSYSETSSAPPLASSSLSMELVAVEISCRVLRSRRFCGASFDHPELDQPQTLTAYRTLMSLEFRGRVL
ncbi:hypothetical protein NE237_031823 [Protea cynaroides]|uniref:Uncharacterized protein n=1 Tax=Protea cynaroides TaxID=273540 RepID=A0A9Q0L2W6_9MAGN|nr:hypothetical protein NE237_031823 [Protea cynaroides]